jgi:hypothetical protein
MSSKVFGLFALLHLVGTYTGTLLPAAEVKKQP